MGIHSAVTLVAVVAFSLTLSATAQQQGDCTTRTTDGRTPGQCTPIRQCGYFMRMLTAPTVSQRDRILMRENQCSPKQPDDKIVYVCCPLDGKQGLSALRHPLLPRECGAVKWERIVNVTETKIKEYPWLALIEYTKPTQDKLHACGGVLISERYILTAAHCATSTVISNLGWRITNVRLGEWDTLTNPDCHVTNNGAGETVCAPPYQDVPIEEIIVHPSYNKDGVSQMHDIAMIRLKDPVQFSDFLQPICLPNKQLDADELVGLVTEVAGWQAKSSSRMKKSEVIITAFEKCQKKYAERNVQIVPSHLCGAPNADECHGNSGGPLMLLHDNAYLLGGLLSFGPVLCPNRDHPDIYTRVAAYTEWIIENLRA
ncbi:serine protease easter [Drosophila grimshawi]|uniref:CLIP domain-containing serine protease n=1 Tax=Drosophila grimshawi TaxID=7222 RepID=B4JH57_DROGR|nr:serine protease easter [Drosophila grimshawi]EDV92748.1 GH18659 [Drosophila grimshawi]